MRRALYLVRHPSGVYHFRFIVPSHARAAFGGRKVIKQSLRTHDLSTAQVVACTLAARYAGALLHLKGSPVAKPPSVENLIRAQERGEIEPYKVRLPSGMEIEAEGPGEHARALELIGRLPPAAFFAASVPPTAPAVEAITLAEALVKFSASLNAETNYKTGTQKTAAVSGLVNHVGTSVVLSSVSRPQVARLFEWWRNTVGLETPTLKNKESYLAGFFAWAQGAGYYPPGENPARGHVSYGDRAKRARRKLGFRRFESDELARLFDATTLRTLQPRARWGAVLGLYLGARVSEIAQLALVDFSERDGVLCLSITDEGEGQSLKNDVSKRIVPIHPHLLALGLGDRVERLRQLGERDLLPHAIEDDDEDVEGPAWRRKSGPANGRGAWLGKSFTRYLGKQGVRSQEGAAKVGFHSLRKTLIQALVDAGMAPEPRTQYVGHQIDDEHRAAYGRTLTPSEMLTGLAEGKFRTAGLNELAYGLDLDTLRAVLWWEGHDTDRGKRRTR